MNTKELMIGDWVMYEDHPYQIRQLGIYDEDRDGNDYPAVCIGKPQGIGLIVERNEISPISITSEILLKNEFQEGCSSHYILYDDKEDDDSEPVGGYEIRYYPGNNFCSIQNLETEADISFYCEYIHQLQQAMRLCGIEKEIILN